MFGPVANEPVPLWLTVGQIATGRTEAARVPNACLYKMDGAFFSALSLFMSLDFFAGSCQYDAMLSGQIECEDSWWLAPLWAENNATAAGLAGAVDDFARTVTDKLRMTGLGPDAQRRPGFRFCGRSSQRLERPLKSGLTSP